MNELQKRVVTGVLGVSLLLSIVVWGGFLGIWLIATVVALGMITEFVNIAFALPDRNEKRIVLQACTFFLALTSAVFPLREPVFGIFIFLFLSTYFLISARRYEGATLLAHCQELMYSVFGLVYLAILPLFLPAIRRQSFGAGWIFLFLVIVWSGDTGAYFVGKKFGKRKLYPLISPKKTVEGALGGLAGSVIAAIAFRQLAFNHIGLVSVSVMAILVCAVSQVGDFCESFVKRAFDKKDSGSILPGHGGFLDRFDSVVFSLPIMYACTRYLSL